MTASACDVAAGGRRVWAAAALLAALTSAAFVSSLRGGFVFDDNRFILENPHVRRPESWLKFLTDAATADPRSPTGIVRPLRTMEFAADRALFGEEPFAFHVHSLVWHVAAALLLFFLLRRVLVDVRVAFVASLVWAVHATHVESVAWISSRGDVAMGACAFAALLFALRSKGYDRDLGVSLVAAAAAALYKETGAMVPFAVVVLRWTKLSRVPLWPYVALAGAYAVYHQAAQSGETGRHVEFVLGGSVAGTFATMSRAFGWYLCQTLLPSFSQDWRLTPSTSFADGAVIAWLAVHAALVVSAVRARSPEPRWTFAVALFYVFLAPVANWPFCLGIATTERFLYVPSAGVALAVGLALTRAPRAALVACVVAAAALGVTSARRSTLWRDGPTLWTAVNVSHESPRGLEFAAERIQFDALALRARAAAMPPGPERDAADVRVRELLEQALAECHRSLDATYAFELVARSDGAPAFRAEYNASNMCFLLGRGEEALFHAEEAIAIDEDMLAEPHYDRALPLLRLGFPVQAMASMRRSLELSRKFAPGPTSPDVAAFFLAAATECARLGLRRAARDALTLAVETSGPGPAQDDARRRLALDAARAWSAEDEARETTTSAALDEKLARLRPSCPVRRDHSIPK